MSAPLQIPTNPRTPLHVMADGIEARLRLGFPDPLFAVELMAAAPSKNELERVLRRKPFLGLSLVDATFEGLHRQLKGMTIWTLLVCVQNEMGAAARFKGDGRGIGLWGAVTCAAGLLHGWTISDAGAVKVVKIDSVQPEGWGDDAIAMMLITLHAEVIFGNAPGSEVDLVDLLRLGATWKSPGIELPEKIIPL